MNIPGNGIICITFKTSSIVQKLFNKQYLKTRFCFKFCCILSSQNFMLGIDSTEELSPCLSCLHIDTFRISY